MVDKMEVKDDMANVVADFPALLGHFDDVYTSLKKADTLLAEQLWKGAAKDKCVHIQGLLKQYQSSVKELVVELQAEVASLENEAQDFPTNSESLAIIKTI